MRETADFAGVEVAQGRITSALHQLRALRTRESVQEERLSQARRVTIVDGKVQPRWWVLTAENCPPVPGATKRRMSTLRTDAPPPAAKAAAAASCARSNPLFERHFRYQRWHQRFVDPAQARWHGIGRMRHARPRTGQPALGEGGGAAATPGRRARGRRRPASGGAAAEQPWPEWRDGSEGASTYSLHGARAPTVSAAARGPAWPTAAQGAVRGALRRGEASRPWMAGHATLPSRVAPPLSRS